MSVMKIIGQRQCQNNCPEQPCGRCAQKQLLVHPVPALSRNEIEEIERHHFPELFEVCHIEVSPKPPLLQALWANCKDF